MFGYLYQVTYESICFLLLGWGVFATHGIKKGSFLLEYRGKKRSAKEMKLLEKQYEEKGLGSYVYYFDFNGKKWWVLLLCVSCILLYCIFLRECKGKLRKIYMMVKWYEINKSIYRYTV